MIVVWEMVRLAQGDRRDKAWDIILKVELTEFANKLDARDERQWPKMGRLQLRLSQRLRPTSQPLVDTFPRMSTWALALSCDSVPTQLDVQAMAISTAPSSLPLPSALPGSCWFYLQNSLQPVLSLCPGLPSCPSPCLSCPPPLSPYHPHSAARASLLNGIVPLLCFKPISCGLWDKTQFSAWVTLSLMIGPLCFSSGDCPLPSPLVPQSP